MPFNGSGTFNRYTPGNPAITGTTISSVTYNATIQDLANGLSNAITRDGQGAPTANQPMASFRITGMANGIDAQDAVTLAQVQSGECLTLSSVAGTNTITGNLSPAITSYVAGQTFRFVSAGANSGAATININGLGAKAITKSGSTALAAGDIPNGAAVTIIYDGTQFQLSSGAGSGGGATGGGTDQIVYENDAFGTANYTLGQAAINIACTFSNGSATVTAANTFVAGQPIRFVTTGTLPTNFDANLSYFVIATGLTTSSFQCSLTVGGAAVVAGSAGSGTHTTGKIKNGTIAGPYTQADGTAFTVPTGAALVIL